MPYTLTSEYLKKLAKHSSQPCITLLGRIPNETSPQHDAVRIMLKNLVRDADQQLDTLDVSAASRDTLLEPARRFLRAPQPIAAPGNTVAIFLAPGFHDIHWLHKPLARQRVHVGERFLLAPLIDDRTMPDTWYVLAIADDIARLIHVDRQGSRKADLPLERQTRADANAERTDPTLGGNLHANRQTQAQAHGPHVQGFGTEQVDDIERQAWYGVIINALQASLPNASTPLVVVADAAHHGPFRAQLERHYPVEATVAHHPQHERIDTLVELAHAAAADQWAAREHLHDARYLQAQQDGRTCDTLHDVLAAARHQRVDDLFWVRPQNGDATPQTPAAMGRDLINEVVCQTLLHGGDVYERHQPLGTFDNNPPIFEATLRW